MSNRHYSDEFKKEAIKQITERGYSVKEVSERLGVTIKTMYTWLNQSKGKVSSKAQNDLESLKNENAKLRSELKRAEEERDILKKAAAYFAKASE